MAKSNRRAYRPVVDDELEIRVVPSGASARTPSVLVSGLTPRLRSLGKSRQPPLMALVNKAFDSFVQDYSLARATYLSGGQDQGANGAFQNYTRYRVNLLGQQIINTGLQSTAKGSKHQQGSGLTLPLVVNRRITGLNDKGDFQTGTLGRALIDATPPINASAATVALDSLAQDQAIEAARVNVLNGFTVIKNGNSGTKSK